VVAVALDTILRVVAADGIGVGVRDMATSMGCVNGAWGLSWGRRGGVGGLLGCCWRRRGWQSCSVECTMCSDERICTTSRNSMSGVAHCRCGLSGAWVAISVVVMVVWVLDPALAVVSGGLIAGVATVVDCDVAVATGGSGCEWRGCGLGFGAVE
jgi:hypothetical protein